MANFELNGAPNKNTVGAIGDICTDINTGVEYECKNVYRFNSYKGEQVEYEWKLVEYDSSDKKVVSPTVSVSEIDGGHRVAITDVNGEKAFNVMDGAKGDKGEKGDKGDTGDTGAAGKDGAKGDKGDKGDTGADGKTPVKGTDYWTEEDKAEIVEEVIAAVGTTE